MDVAPLLAKGRSEAGPQRTTNPRLEAAFDREVASASLLVEWGRLPDSFETMGIRRP